MEAERWNLAGQVGHSRLIGKIPHDIQRLHPFAHARVLIPRALQETGGNITDAARLLGVHRTRIYRKLAP